MPWMESLRQHYEYQNVITNTVVACARHRGYRLHRHSTRMRCNWLALPLLIFGDKCG